MAMAPEAIKPTLNLADKDTLARLNSEGRTPIVMFPNTDIKLGEPYLRSNRMQPRIFIPGSNGEAGQTNSITPEEARMISTLQKELMNH